MAEAIFHLLDSHAPTAPTTLTGSGAVKSWADIAAEVFDLTNGNGSKVKPISTAEYFANATNPVFRVRSTPHLISLRSVKPDTCPLTGEETPQDLRAEANSADSCS